MELTINYKEVELNVEFDYQPYEAPETGPEAQYPGCGEELHVYDVKHKGISLHDLLEDQIEEIEQVIWDEIHKEQDY
ncbi:MAG: hypothetical protein QNK20_16680 [Aureibaculum sp.]|nr:hypothetical protein [Aureibaculum sp.]